MLRVAPCNEVTMGRKCFRIVSYFTSQHPSIPLTCEHKGGIFHPVKKEDKKILVFGGGFPVANGLKNTHSVYSFEPEKSLWSKLGNLPFPIRGAVALTVPSIGVLVAGGYIEKGEFSNSVLKFDPETNQFNSLTQLPIGLMLPAFVLDGEWLYLFGGEDAPEKRSKRAFRAFLPNLLRLQSNQDSL